MKGASFAERVLNQGLATVQQIEDALRVQQRCLRDGFEKDLGDIMFERGYLTRAQLEQLSGDLTPVPGPAPALTATLPPPPAPVSAPTAPRPIAVLPPARPVGSRTIDAPPPPQPVSAPTMGRPIAVVPPAPRPTGSRTIDAPPPPPAAPDDDLTRFEVPAFGREGSDGDTADVPRAQLLKGRNAAAEARRDPDATRIEVPIPHVPSGSAGDTADMLPPQPDVKAARATKSRGSSKLEIPGYALEAKLGEGAMGEVHKARDLKTGATVAIKILPPHLATNNEYIARFHREAASAKKLQHPNIVAGIDDGEIDGFHYFVMEFVDGESLEKRLKRMGRLPEAETIDIGIGVANALECAYQAQIVHRDLKPGNIQLTNEGKVKVLDLGLAKSVGSGEAGKPQLTKVGIILGSPYYLAPEQAAMTAVDHRTDLYALGATLFHLITGTVAFDGDTPVDIVDKLLSTPAPDAHERAPNISLAMSKIIDKLMAKKKENRFQTPTELRDALQHLKTRPKRSRITTFFRRILRLDP